MAENAFVTWHPIAEAWLLEEQFIATVSLPLNLDQNRNHAFRYGRAAGW
jgi:GIY-YIG catalytic domain